jgi:hypothetical protein
MFIVNPGIKDLDPHQKTVLADDIGMALALGLLDEKYGIVGLADVYAWHEEKLLTLKEKGKHRRMPDFAIKLRKPVSSSRIVLLECKGSTSKRSFTTTLEHACNGQLDNVDKVFGKNAGSVPKIAAASSLLIGRQAVIHFEDPPERLGELGNRLEANYLALEYSLFGDLRSANAVWQKYDLPSFGLEAQLPERDITAMEDEAVTSLVRPHGLKLEAVGEFETQATKREGFARSHVHLEMSEAAKEARPNLLWDHVLSMREQGNPQFIDDKASVTQVQDESLGRRRILEAATTSSGIRVKASTDVWLVG